MLIPPTTPRISRQLCSLRLLKALTRSLARALTCSLAHAQSKRARFFILVCERPRQMLIPARILSHRHLQMISFFFSGLPAAGLQ